MADRRLLTRRERRKSVAIKERSPRLLRRSLNDEIEATLSNAWLELTQFRPDAEIPLFIRPVRYRRLPMETRNALSREKELFPNDGAATGRARSIFLRRRSISISVARKKEKKKTCAYSYNRLLLIRNDAESVQKCGNRFWNDTLQS